MNEGFTEVQSVDKTSLVELLEINRGNLSSEELDRCFSLLQKEYIKREMSYEI